MGAAPGQGLAAEERRRHRALDQHQDHAEQQGADPDDEDTADAEEASCCRSPGRRTGTEAKTNAPSSMTPPRNGSTPCMTTSRRLSVIVVR